MLELKDFMPVNFLEKEKFTGKPQRECVFVWRSWIWKVRTAPPGVTYLA